MSTVSITTVSVRLEIWIISSTDVTNRYLGWKWDETISSDWSEWPPNRIVVGVSDVGKKVLDTTKILYPGDHMISILITDYAYPRCEQWTVKAKISLSTGQVLAEKQFKISKCPDYKPENITFTVPGTPPPPGTEPPEEEEEGGGVDISRIMNEMINKMVPSMMQMMGMMMMMNMMISMMQSMAGAFAGGL